MNWIRMATGMKNDPRIHGMAAACCKGDPAKVVGHLQFLFSELPEHARDGDLSRVPAAVVEAWACWNGKKGALHAAVLNHLCTDAGVIRSWQKHNGGAIQKADDEKERLRLWRENKKRPGEAAA